jgi:hypothetical protein
MEYRQHGGAGITCALTGPSAAAQRHSVGRNLAEPLAAEPQQAFVDLVYVAETTYTTALRRS